MHRRSFIRQPCYRIIVLSRASPAQSIRKVYRIGIFGMAVTSEVMAGRSRGPSALAFVRGSARTGLRFVEHFVTEVRGAEGKPERFPQISAHELVDSRVDVIVAQDRRCLRLSKRPRPSLSSWRPPATRSGHGVCPKP